MTFYEVINLDTEILGGYLTFSEASKHKVSGTTIRYFDGFAYIYNVTKQQ
jgi:hypothetical protein